MNPLPSIKNTVMGESKLDHERYILTLPLPTPPITSASKKEWRKWGKKRLRKTNT